MSLPRYVVNWPDVIGSIIPDIDSGNYETKKRKAKGLRAVIEHGVNSLVWSSEDDIIITGIQVTTSHDSKPISFDLIIDDSIRFEDVWVGGESKYKNLSVFEEVAQDTNVSFSISSNHDSVFNMWIDVDYMIDF